MIKYTLIALAIAATIPFGGMHGLVAGPVLPREDIKTFSQDATKLAKLRAAVGALKARGLDDATAWFNLAAIHGIRSDDPNTGSVPYALT